MEVQFLGAAGTVTGSRILVKTKNTQILLDCGLFQGLKRLRLKNWQPAPDYLKHLDAIVLGHAHLDHSGYIPRLFAQGFRKPVFCTRATRELAKILLEDCGYLAEEDASWANKMGFSKHKPALALYTRQNALECMDLFQTQNFNHPFHINELEVSFIPAGHILGAASIVIKAQNKHLVYSGDLGRWDDVLMAPPQIPNKASHLILESTYGDRNHERPDPTEALRPFVEQIISRNSILLIPAFAVARTQAVLKCLFDLFERYPNTKVPVFVNSPMATDVTELYETYYPYHKLDQNHCRQVCNLPEFVRTKEESKALNRKKGPAIIISASGMLTGGRVLHHLKKLAPHPENIILLVGYQAPGTRGASLVAGQKCLKIHGEEIPVRAELVSFDFLSAHADQSDLIRWVQEIPHPPKQVFLVHGEPSSADALRFQLEQKLPESEILAVGENERFVLK